MLPILIVNLLLHEVIAAPSEQANSKGFITKEVYYGETVLLQCKSNVNNYNFDYWVFNDRKVVIGPSNSYDRLKYRYEILSGNLTVRAVTESDQGLYSCVSRAVHNENINIEHVDVVVILQWEQVYEHDSSINVIRILISLIVLVLVAVCGYILYSIWKDRYRYPRYLEQSEDEDEDSGDEIFTAPSTSGISKTAKKEEKHGSFDNISTDFRSILDAANEK
ncbi:hypothetical protein NQ315_002485 [Exocentrus adspersus]|uniref:Ig-like domain-containing protein n=1 Tax=Exocentrus adspersus TaxID=1586481 RepID=A0AAV8VM62_9CUCU|nr:hypothetical protein NQ315_002485 [Exocentrus adspersus]